MSGALSPYPGLWVKNGFVYFGSTEGIYRVATGGSNREGVVTNLNSAYDLALDNDYIYWTDATRPNGTVRQMSLGGGAIVTLATNLAEPSVVTLDSTNVYWLERDGGRTGRGLLRWASKAPNLGDAISPSVSFVSPSDGARFGEAALSVRGSASDDTSVNVVEIRLNNGVWQTASGTTNWTYSLTLVGGTNTIEARSRDSAMNYSSPASITVIYVPPETRLPQSIVFESLVKQVFGDAPFALSASARLRLTGEIFTPRWTGRSEPKHCDDYGTGSGGVARNTGW